MRPRAIVLLAVVVGMLAQVLPAQACTCPPPGDPRDELERADGAVIGTVIERRSGHPYAEVVLTLRVDEPIKGELGETVDVYAAAHGAACGLDGDVGTQYGLLLSYGPKTGTWSSSSCQTADPERLRAAAAPLPEPDGRGRVRLLVGGSWGEVSYMALDSSGRTLGYGLGDKARARLVPCPGSRRFLEVYRRNRGWTIALRHLASNDLIDTTVVPVSDGSRRGTWMPALTCGGTRGGSLLLALAGYDRAGWGHVARFRGRDQDWRYFGRLDDAVFGPRGVAYLQRDRQIVELDLSSERVTPVVRFGSRPYTLALSPKAAKLATILGRDVAVVDLDSGRSRRIDLSGKYSEAQWMDEERLVLFSDAYPAEVAVLRVASGRLRPIDGDWYGWENVVTGRYAYGLSEGQLMRARLPDGPVEEIRWFESWKIDSLAVVRPPRHVDWPQPPE